MKLVSTLLLAALAGCGFKPEAYSPYSVRPSANAKPWETTAACELGDFLAQATTGRVTVEGKSGVVFHVGDTDFARAKGLGPNTFKDEEWCVKSFGRDVVLTGGGRRGALYAVYHFLEDDCGVRFWSEDEVDVPHAEKLAFGRLDRRGRPYFRRRVIFRGIENGERQAVRCRLNSTGHRLIPASLGGDGMVVGGPYHTHTWDRLIPFKRFGKEHPEWFSLVKGERVGGQHVGQLCVTCPGLVDVFAAEVEKWIVRDRAKAAANDTDAPSVYCFTPNDNHGFCDCPACRAEFEKYGRSGQILRFQNAVAEKLGAKYPDLTFTVSAYSETEALPKGGVVPAKNLVAKVCNTKGNLAVSPREPENRVLAGLLRDWGRLCPLQFHEYGITFGFQYEGRPLPSEFSIVDRYRFYAEKGATGGLVELECDRAEETDMDELKFYLTRHALEDPFADSEALIDDFMSRYYGPAGADILAVRKYLFGVCRARGAFIPFDAKINFWDFYDDAVLAEAARRFDAAEARVRDDAKLLGRVERARASVDRLAGFRRRMATLSAPEAGVSEKPFLDFPVTEDMWHCYARSDIRFMKDPEALGGQAIGVTVTEKNRKTFVRPFECGLSSANRKVRQSITIDKPAGPGYRWYDLGEFTSPDCELLVWMTWTWTMQFKYRAPKFDGRKMRAKLHLKFSGPDFIPGSAGPSVILADRIVFIPED